MSMHGGVCVGGGFLHIKKINNKISIVMTL